MTRAFVEIYSRLFARRDKTVDEVRSIAAVWYWPIDYPSASLTRLGSWKKYFEQDGIRFDNFYLGSMAEKVRFEAGSWTFRYWFYIKVIFWRLPQFARLKNYDVVWIDRWFLPYYPSKTAYWERAIQRMTGKLVIDSTDGTDYEGNATLIKSIFDIADRITVAYEGLYEFYTPKYGDKVKRFNYTIIEDDYLIRENWEQKDVLTIGWMGSPFNFEYVRAIKSELQKVAREIPFKMIIICRHDVEIDIPGAEIVYKRFGPDYEELIQSFDIGIAPFTEKTFSNTGKIGMKHQEFLLCQVPQVCSPQGISEHAVHDEHCLIADDLEEWAPALLRLMKDASLRERLARNGRALCLEHYTFDGQWPLAKEALTRF